MKVDIYRRSINSGSMVFTYFCSSTQFRRINDAIKALPVEYAFTKKGKQYYSDGIYYYVGYKGVK